jgi:hypothetical protein
MKNAIKKVFVGITKKQCAEFGLVTILVTVFLALYLQQNQFTIAAFILTLITIIIPIALYPFAAVWFGLSKILGAVSSRILLAIIFLILVTPVGLCRRFLKKDSLNIRQFKKSTKSVMVDRNHRYTAEDLVDTF